MIDLHSVLETMVGHFEFCCNNLHENETSSYGVEFHDSNGFNLQALFVFGFQLSTCTHNELHFQAALQFTAIVAWCLHITQLGTLHILAPVHNAPYHFITC